MLISKSSVNILVISKTESIRRKRVGHCSPFLVLFICNYRHTKSYVNVLLYIRFTGEACRYVISREVSRSYSKKKNTSTAMFLGDYTQFKNQIIKRFQINFKSPPYVNLLCKYWGFHSSVVKNSNLLQCDAMSLGKWFLTFWRNMLPSFSRVQSPWTLNPWRWTTYQAINFYLFKCLQLFEFKIIFNMLTKRIIFTVKFWVHEGRKGLLRLRTWVQPSPHCAASQYLHPCQVLLLRFSVLTLIYLVITTAHTYTLLIPTLMPWLKEVTTYFTSTVLTQEW